MTVACTNCGGSGSLPDMTCCAVCGGGGLVPESADQEYARESTAGRYRALLAALRALEAEMRADLRDVYAKHWANRLAALLKEHGGA